MLLPQDKLTLVKRLTTYEQWRLKRWLLWILLVIPFLILLSYLFMKRRKRRVVALQQPMPPPPPPQMMNAPPPGSGYYYNQQMGPMDGGAGYKNDLPPQPNPGYVPPEYPNQYQELGSYGNTNGYSNQNFAPPPGAPPPTDEYGPPSGPPPAHTKN